MILTYAKRSRFSANAIAEESDDVEAVQSGNGDVNWGRARADTSLNPDISNCTNKRVMRELFRDNDVPMPYLYEPGDNYHSWPVVGRPDHHMKKRGFWLCRNTRDIQRALRGTRRKKAATHFMEYVEADREYRVHIFKGRSIRISEKEFFINEGKRDYTTIRPSGDVRPIRKAAKKAVAALGLDFGAVDVLATEAKCWVLEVNAAPGLGGSMPRVYADAFLAWERGEYEYDE